MKDVVCQEIYVTVHGFQLPANGCPGSVQVFKEKQPHHAY